jgi:hypothetical protein
MNGNQEGCFQGILVRAFLARHEVISAIVLCIILGNKYQVQVMIIFENNKPNILFREHFNGMYGTDAFFYAKQVVDIQLYIVDATKMLSLIYWNVNLNQIYVLHRAPLHSQVVVVPRLRRSMLRSLRIIRRVENQRRTKMEILTTTRRTVDCTFLVVVS